jgi:Protein of unknown function (DUF2786)
MEPNAAVLSKIQKMLNLADPSRGGTEAERDTAMRMAQELMFKYDLELFEVEQHEDKTDPNRKNQSRVTQHEHHVQGQSKQWQGMLYHYIASGCQCKVIYYKESRKSSRWLIYGSEDNLALLEMLHRMLVPWLIEQNKIDRRRDGPSNPNAYNRAWYDRAGNVIMWRLRDQLDKMTRASITGTELVLHRSAQVEEYVQERHQNLRYSKARNYSNEAGARAGREAGYRADLSGDRKLAR